MIGKRLRELRENKGITQEELGKELNLTKANISKYESGKLEPNLETINYLADFFNVSTDYLLGRTDNQKEIIYPLPQEKELEKIFDSEIFYKGKPLTAEEKEGVKKFIDLAIETIRKKEIDKS